jgi:hypothetical protein
MALYRSKPVEERPEILLSRWSIRETNSGERHFVGHDVLYCDGRVSTAIKTFDPGTRIGKTASGRIYKLDGRAGTDPDAEYVWGRVLALWEIEDWRDVTAELVPDWRSHLPLADSAGEGDGFTDDNQSANGADAT